MANKYRIELDDITLDAEELDCLYSAAMTGLDELAAETDASSIIEELTGRPYDPPTAPPPPRRKPPRKRPPRMTI